MSKLRWVIAIEVEEHWVAAGVDFTRIRVEDMIENELLFVPPREISISILEHPPADQIRILQEKS